MGWYLVRAIETKEAVGVFWARNAFELWSVVDEICSPTDCERAKFEATFGLGIAWAGPTKTKFPIPDRDEAEEGDVEGEELDMSGLSFTDGILGAMCDTKLRWRRFESFEWFARHLMGHAD
ncbi:MAG: hypothetical protein RLZZ403_241 [Pseudomonadota bacterium]|jgi:hypothetical protein